MNNITTMPTKEEYSKRVKKATPNSKLGLNMVKAFLVGGLICVIAECIKALLMIKLEQKTAEAFLTIILIGIGVLLTILNLYQKIGKFAGAGSIVPITGFANSIASPAMEFKNEGLITGTGVKIFTVAGPVLVYGIGSSALLGLIIWIFSLIGG